MCSASRVSGKICVVFGGSSGIGKSVCQVFAEQGARVVVIGRNGDKATETVKSLVDLSPDTIEHGSHSCDVRDSTQVQKTISQIESNHGNISVLINAAGINKDALLIRSKMSDIENVMSTNLVGSIYTCRAVVKSMIHRRGGSIVNIGSVVGLKGNAGQSIYSASKSGLIGFTKSLAKEVASKGIHVNLVAPGFIETPMTATVDLTYKSVIPLSRFGDPLEVARGVLFLVNSSYITGQVLIIDGGLNLTI